MQRLLTQLILRPQHTLCRKPPAIYKLGVGLHPEPHTGYST